MLARQVLFLTEPSAQFSKHNNYNDLWVGYFYFSKTFLVPYCIPSTGKGDTGGVQGQPLLHDKPLYQNKDVQHGSLMHMCWNAQISEFSTSIGTHITTVSQGTEHLPCSRKVVSICNSQTDTCPLQLSGSLPVNTSVCWVLMC